MSDFFWQRRVSGLKRGKHVPDHRIMAIRAGKATFLEPETGELTSCDLGQLSSAIVDMIAADVKLVVTMHPGYRLLDTLARANVLQDLSQNGHIIKPYESQQRTAGIVIAESTDVETLKGPKLEIWDIGTFFPGVTRHEHGSTACAAIARHWADLCELTETHYGTRPEMTPARTGNNAWRKHWDGSMWRKPRAARKHGRQAFHGGYTKAFKTGLTVRQAKQYDINSAYPWAMRQGVPAGTPVWFTGENGEIPAELRSCPGIVWAHVITRPRSIGIIMWRGMDTEKPTARDREPAVGETYYALEGWTTTQEIELAREMGDAIAIRYGWIYPDGLDYAFNDAVDAFEDARFAAREKSKHLEQAAKLIQNSTWGSLARKPVRDEVVITPERPGPEWFPYYASSGMVTGAWTRQVDVDHDARQQIAIAAWITATVRCKLARTIMEIGIEHVIYADTDSVVVDHTVTLPTGDAYGDWKLERMYSLYRAYGGKRYEGVTVDGEHLVRAAGINANVFRNGGMLASIYGYDALAPPGGDGVYIGCGDLPHETPETPAQFGA